MRESLEEKGSQQTPKGKLCRGNGLEIPDRRVWGKIRTKRLQKENSAPESGPEIPERRVWRKVGARDSKR